MPKKKKTPRPKPSSLWVSVWKEVAIVGRRETIAYTLFTIAHSRKEAVTIMSDGVMGLPGVEGSSTKPDSIARVDVSLKEAPVVIVELVKRGAYFIPPYERLKASQMVFIVYVLLADGV